MTTTSDDRAKREAMRKRAARLGLTLDHCPDTPGNTYMLSNANGAMTFDTLDEVANEMQARSGPRQRRQMQ